MSPNHPTFESWQRIERCFNRYAWELISDIGFCPYQHLRTHIWRLAHALKCMRAIPHRVFVVFCCCVVYLSSRRLALSRSLLGKTVSNRRDQCLFPMSSGASEWASEWTDKRSRARAGGEQSCSFDSEEHDSGHQEPILARRWFEARRNRRNESEKV